MADTKHKIERPSTDVPVQRSSSERHGTGREWQRSSFSPFSIMRQGIDEMERWFGHMGRGASGRGMLSQLAQQAGDWTPAIEAFQRGNEYVVRAEVPGMNRQDLTVEVGDETLMIRGERRHERADENEGMLWTERSYGSFTRVIPLPPGAIAETAKASFHNGMLEVVIPAPSAEARRGRRVDISGGDDGTKK